MILNVFLAGSWRHFESQDEIAILISNLTTREELQFRIEASGGASQDAWFGFSEFSLEGNEVPDPFLRVGVNRETGYGGLVWGVTNALGCQHGVWVSDNPSPPLFDPRVISDPGVSLFYEPQSTVPLKLVRAVLYEFCSSGNGIRPACIKWTPGHVNGKRVDSKLRVEMVDDVDPWA